MDELTTTRELMRVLLLAGGIIAIVCGVFFAATILTKPDLLLGDSVGSRRRIYYYGLLGGGIAGIVLGVAFLVLSRNV